LFTKGTATALTIGIDDINEMPRMYEEKQKKI